MPLFHRTLQDSNNFLRRSERHVHIENADQFPALFTQLIQASVESFVPSHR